MENSSQIKEQIIKNSFWSIVSSFINRIGGFILIILLSRMLMPEGFGKYSLVMTISLFFITFSDLGINQTLVRYLSLEIDKDKSKTRAYFKHLFKTRFLLTLSASLILLAGAYPLSSFIFHDLSLFPYLLILSFYVFIISFVGFLESLFFIKKNVKYISIKESISLILKIIALIIIGYFIGAEYKLSYIFLSFTGIALLSFFLNLYFSKRSYPFLFKKTTKKGVDKKGISKFILFLNIQNISFMILSQTTIILLGVFLTKEYVGYYNASWALILGIISLLFSFSSMFLPIFTSVDEETFQNLLKKIFRLFFIFALPISFGLSLLSRFFIIAIYGQAYLPASVSLSILSFLIPCMIGIDLALTSFSARNKQKKFSVIMIIFALIFILLNYLFIKFLSTSGESILINVSIANLIIWLSCFLVGAFFLKKELKVNLFSWDIAKIILSCLVMSAFILFSLHFFKDMNLFTGIVIITISAVIYTLFLLLMGGIGKGDIILLKQIIKKK